jgi:hypothetical protein
MHCSPTSRFAAAILIAVSLAACRTAPIYEVTEAEFVGERATSLEQRAVIIERAADELGWIARRMGPGEIAAKKVVRGHVAIVSIHYDLDQFSIQYKRSNGLKYKEGEIHRTYNIWVQTLSSQIQDTAASVLESPRSTPPQSVAMARRQPERDDRAEAGEFGQRWAVVVGISQYRFSGPGGFENLDFADNDAKDFYKKLLELGWEEDHISLLVDEQATKRGVEYALESWLRRSGRDDLVVVFWATHGWPDPEDSEKAYFATYDSRPSDLSSGLRMDRVRQSIQERRAKNVVFIADTCHSGKVIRSGDPRSMSVVPALEAMRKTKTIPRGWVFITSADSDRMAYEDKAWSNGALTQVLLEGLDGGADGYQSVGRQDGTVSLGELRAYISNRMAEESIRVLGARLEPLFYTTSGDPGIWEINLEFSEQDG